MMAEQGMLLFPSPVSCLCFVNDSSLELHVLVLVWNIYEVHVSIYIVTRPFCCVALQKPKRSNYRFGQNSIRQVFDISVPLSSALTTDLKLQQQSYFTLLYLYFYLSKGFEYLSTPAVGRKGGSQVTLL